jgi:polar amino acid transport system substrate-binding protein
MRADVIRIVGTSQRLLSGAVKPRALRTAAVVVVLCLAASGCGADNTAADSGPAAPKVVKDGSLTVCTALPYEPFEFTKDGKPAGFDIDLAGEVAKKLQLKPVIVNTDFDKIASGEPLNDGTCDVAVAGMTITGDRARVLDFSSPYFDAAQAMVVKKGSGVKSLADLAGKKIGVQKGTTGELYVTDNAPADTKIVTFTDASDIDAALKAGHVDAAVYDNTVVGDVVARNSDFAIAGEFNTGEQYGMAVKKNGSVDLLRTIDNLLASLKDDGRYDAIYRKWFGNAPTA